MSSSTAVMPFSQDLLILRFLPSANPPACSTLWVPMCFHTTAPDVHTHTLPALSPLASPLVFTALLLTAVPAYDHTAEGHRRHSRASSHSCIHFRNHTWDGDDNAQGRWGPCSPRAGGQEKYYITLIIQMGTVKGQCRVPVEGAVRGLSLFQGTRQDFPRRHRCSHHRTSGQVSHLLVN